MWLCSYVFIIVLSVTTAKTNKCFCDHHNRVVMCSRLNLSEFRAPDVLCNKFVEIDLSENAFREYPKALRLFKTVNLSRNGIEYLDSSEEQAVYFLDLSENTLKNIDFGDTFLSLRKLNASGNFLGDGDDNFLRGWCYLTHLDISKNKIKYLHSITKCAQLTILVAQHNMISRLPDNFFMLRKLQMLHILYNKLLYVSDFPRSLKTLDLSSNELTAVENITFRGLSSLTELYLVENKVSIVNLEAWTSLSSLEKLHLERNQLSVITSESFLGLKKLKVLQLRDNYIESVPADTFSNLLDLETLGLDGNLLKSLPPLLLGANVKSITFTFNLIKNMNLSAILILFSGTTAERVVTLFLNPLRGDDPEWPKIMRLFDWECFTDTEAKITEMLLQDTSIYSPTRSYDMASTPCTSVRFFKDNHFLGISLIHAAEIHGYPWYIVALKSEKQFNSNHDVDSDDDNKLHHEDL